MLNFTLDTDPEVVLFALRPLLIPVYEALEQAIPKAVQIVAENGWEGSGHLVSHMTRADTKRFLKDRPRPIEVDDIPRAVAMENVAMEGLSTKFEGLAVRILKGSEIPKATTEPRTAFYQHFNPNLWVDGTVPPLRCLLVLWDCSEAGTNLSLQLCCTKDSMCKDYWMIPVPHPANWMIVQRETPSRSDDLDDLFRDDESQESEQ
ncbi:MAG: hypothetical protein ABSD43_03125 [Terracidiphilus sp.]|jgi:hypothetical protein